MLHLRYVKDRQINISFAKNCIDLSDFRTRIDFGVKVESEELEKKCINKQLELLRIESEKPDKLDKGKLSAEAKEKIEYLRYKFGHLMIEEDKNLLKLTTQIDQPLNQVQQGNVKKLKFTTSSKQLKKINKNELEIV